MTPIDRTFASLLRLASIALMLAGVATVASHDAHGQQAANMTAVYGRGVHAYFNNSAYDADQLLSQVINAGSTDPRVYYFRAMARLRSGRQYEAAQDMRLGAAYEARDPGAAGNVGQALTRIQGPDRQLLEQYRRQARAYRAQQQQLLSQSRYQQMPSSEAGVLRHETPIRLNELTPTAPPAVLVPQATPAPAAASPPTPQPELATDPPAPAARIEVAPAPAATPAPVPEVGEDNPFGAEPGAALPLPSQAAQDSALEEAVEDNSAGRAAAAGSTPFAPEAEEDRLEEGAAEAAPAADQPPADGEDPFGADSAEAPLPVPSQAAEDAALEEATATDSAGRAAAAGSEPFAPEAESRVRVEAPGADAASEDPFSSDGAAPAEDSPAEPPADDEPIASDADPLASPADTAPPEGQFGEAAAPPAAASGGEGKSMGGVLGRLLGRTVTGMSPVPPEVVRGMVPPLGQDGPAAPGAIPSDPATTPPADAASADEPFGTPTDAPGESTPVEGVEPPAVPPQSPPAGEEDPFGAPAASPAEPAAESAAPPAGEEDPFGDASSEPATDAPPAGEEPASDADAPAEEDPFSS